jgi:hypothetical protein
MEIYSESLKALNENIRINMLILMRHERRIILEGPFLSKVFQYYNLYRHEFQIYKSKLLISAGS